MTHPPPIAADDLQFYATAAYPCSYLPGQLARSQVAAPTEAIDQDSYSTLVQQGFRRSGAFIYRPNCDACQACTSIRVSAPNFLANRSQKRAWRQHAHLTAHLVEPHFSAEHYALYTRYQKSRHAGGGMDHDDISQYIEFLVKSSVPSFMVEFRDHRHNAPIGDLKMVSIIDRLNDGLSAVYTFYAPEAGQSFGTFNVLWQIEQARAWGLDFLYLGYWIQDCKKMSYKTRFHPSELFIGEHWQAVNFTK